MFWLGFLIGFSVMSIFTLFSLVAYGDRNKKLSIFFGGIGLWVVLLVSKIIELIRKKIKKNKR